MPPKGNSIANDIMFSSSSAASGIDNESIKQIKREIEFIDKLQSLVDYGNATVLESFKIRLEMEEHSDNIYEKEESEI